jgi:alkylated DNA repair dioxygenase AlkB
MGVDTNNSIEQRKLFSDLLEESPNSNIKPSDVPSIPGLQYIRDFIDQQKHDDLLCQIDSFPWLTDLKRRVQHYGYKYEYKSRSVNNSMRIGPLPQWAEELADILCERRLAPERPDQVIVNEYRPGQGIANHIDCVPCFTDTIISLSLGSPCVMDLTNKETRQVLPLLLEPRSLVIMQGEARFAWMHGIPARKTDQYQNRTIQRGRRVSLTFRKVILDSPEPAAECPRPSQPNADAEGQTTEGLKSMNYDDWSYFNLLNLKEQVEDSVRSGQPMRAVLLAVNKEIAERRFALVGLLGESIVKEYGRWKSRERCEEQAKRMGLSVGTPFEFEKQPFETVVRELF